MRVYWVVVYGNWVCGYDCCYGGCGNYRDCEVEDCLNLWFF